MIFLFFLLQFCESAQLASYEISENALFECENCIYGPVHFNFSFNFFGNAFDKIYIHNDGFVSFDQCAKLYSSENAISVFNTNEFISGRIYYKEIKDYYLLNKYSQHVRYKHDNYFCATWGYQITWIEIKTQIKQLKNSYQLIFLANKNKSFIITIYGNIDWPYCNGSYYNSGLIVKGQLIRNNMSITEMLLSTNNTQKGIWVRKVDLPPTNSAAAATLNYFMFFFLILKK